MEIIGDDKRLRALYSEARFVDEQVAPSFSATWHRAQSRAKQPRRGFNLAFASALALVIFAVATFAIWSKYSHLAQGYTASASAAANNIPASPRIDKSAGNNSNATAYLRNAPIKIRPKRISIERQSLNVAENRNVEKAAKEIASWQSPTASLLTSSSDELFKSLPQLNENANELKSFLPNRSNDKEN